MNRIIILFALSLFISSCGTESAQEIFDNNITEIEEYLATNNLTAEVSDTGLHYIIDEPGGAAKPNQFNTVTVNYVGTLLSGFQFDAGDNITFPLNGVIAGWTEGLQLIGIGGKIRLYIPSNLGYGENPPAGSSIPENSVLAFDVTMLDFN